MKHAERLALLQEWEKHYRELDRVTISLEAVVGNIVESPLGATMWKVFEQYTAVLSQLVGDSFDWLNWYWLENNMGRKKMTAQAARWKVWRKITNIKILCTLIEADVDKD